MKIKGNSQGEIHVSQRHVPIPTLLLSSHEVLTGMGNILLMWLLSNLMEFPDWPSVKFSQQQK